MFFSNNFEELPIIQVGMVIILLCTVIMSYIILLQGKHQKKTDLFQYFKENITQKEIILSIVIGISITLFTSFLARGYYSGMQFVEAFGWPLHYIYQYKNMVSIDILYTSAAFRIDFNPIRFFTDVILFSSLTFSVFCILKNESLKLLHKIITIIVTIVITLGLLITCHLYNLSQIEYGREKQEDTLKRSQSPSEQDLQLFDKYYAASQLPIAENSKSLCQGLYTSSDFSKLEPAIAVAQLNEIQNDLPYTFIFKGKVTTGKMYIPMTSEEKESYQIGSYYKVDMMNLCRDVFMMADNMQPSKIRTTFVKPIIIEKVNKN